MNYKKITALALSLALCVGITANAATSLQPTEKSDKETKKIELKNGKFKKRHHDGGLFKAAKEMGITKEEMKDAKENGKNFFELAKKKGYSEQQVRDMMIKNKNESLDKAVEKGKMPKDKAEEIKTKIKDRINNWDGTLRKHEDVKKESKEQQKN